MSVPILCLVVVLFLSWNLILKTEIADLKKEIERLKGLLKNKLGHLENEVTVTQGRRSTSRQPEGH